jgi:hypothetical protein
MDLLQADYSEGCVRERHRSSGVAAWAVYCAPLAARALRVDVALAPRSVRSAALTAAAVTRWTPWGYSATAAGAC